MTKTVGSVARSASSSADCGVLVPAGPVSPGAASPRRRRPHPHLAGSADELRIAGDGNDLLDDAVFLVALDEEDGMPGLEQLGERLAERSSRGGRLRVAHRRTLLP
ncbi:MAG TPA: hypothetical protein VJS45_19285 [Acidimicrobiia bacterium]|nr:hypothetical protein [Acidimicrobiia bacterium]